jgi:hypothetical protein
MPRFIYLLGLGLALIGLALAVTDQVMGPAPGVTEANVRRIKPGMKMAEVEAILGGPGQWHSAKGSAVYHWGTYEWKGSAGTSLITFRSECVWEHGLRFVDTGRERVVEVTFQQTAGQPLLARLRAWLGL